MVAGCFFPNAKLHLHSLEGGQERSTSGVSPYAAVFEHSPPLPLHAPLRNGWLPRRAAWAVPASTRRKCCQLRPAGCRGCSVPGCTRVIAGGCSAGLAFPRLERPADCYTCCTSHWPTAARSLWPDGTCWSCPRCPCTASRPPSSHLVRQERKKEDEPGLHDALEATEEPPSQGQCQSTFWELDVKARTLQPIDSSFSRFLSRSVALVVAMVDDRDLGRFAVSHSGFWRPRVASYDCQGAQFRLGGACRPQRACLCRRCHVAAATCRSPPPPLPPPPPHTLQNLLSLAVVVLLIAYSYVTAPRRTQE